MEQITEAKKIGEALEKYFAKATAKECGKCVEQCCNTCAVMNAHFDFKGIISDPRYEPASQMARVIRSHKLNEVPEANEKLRTLQRLYSWDNRKGFLGEKGCGLPREIRSVYCQSTLCNHIQAHVKDWPEFQAQLERLREIRLEAKQLI